MQILKSSIQVNIIVGFSKNIGVNFTVSKTTFTVVHSLKMASYSNVKSLSFLGCIRTAWLEKKMIYIEFLWNITETVNIKADNYKYEYKVLRVLIYFNFRLYKGIKVYQF